MGCVFVGSHPVTTQCSPHASSRTNTPRKAVCWGVRTREGHQDPGLQRGPCAEGQGRAGSRAGSGAVQRGRRSPPGDDRLPRTVQRARCSRHGARHCPRSGQEGRSLPFVLRCLARHLCGRDRCDTQLRVNYRAASPECPRSAPGNPA